MKHVIFCKDYGSVIIANFKRLHFEPQSLFAMSKQHIVGKKVYLFTLNQEGLPKPSWKEGFGVTIAGITTFMHNEFHSSTIKMPSNMNIQFKKISPFICSRTNAIDIGAHSGDTAVAIPAVTCGGTIYTYEPHPKTYHTLVFRGNKIRRST